MPGANLSSIFVLRDYTDAQGISALLSPEKHVIVLGLGFIGMEAAAYCINKCASVTVIGHDVVPFKALFGKDIGNRIKKEHEAKGIELCIAYVMYWYALVILINVPRCEIHCPKQHQAIHSKEK